MSYAVKPMSTVIVSDPLLDLTDMTTVPIIQGPSQLTFQQFTTNSISSSGLSYACVPPQGVFVDRKIVHTVPFRLTITGKVIASNGGFVPNSTLLNSGKFALRQYPIMTMTNTINVQLNSDTYTSSVGDAFAQMVRYNMSSGTQNKDSSSTPCYPDQTQNYSDLPAGSSARNPLGTFSQSSSDILRGAFSGMTVVTNPVVVPTTGAGTTAICVIDALCHEDVMISPLYFGSLMNDVQAFFGLNNINMTFNFYQGLGGKFLSYSDEAIAVSGADTVTGSITNIAIQFNNFTGPAFSYAQATPLLQMKFLTPNVLSMPQPSLQGAYNFAYFDQNVQVTNIPAIPYSATAVVQRAINSITLSQIPRKVYIAVKPSSQSMQNRADLTDTFLSIENVNITFNNTNSILAGASQKQLFDICVKNGYVGSWEHFSGQPIPNSATLGTTGAGVYRGSGSTICLEFGNDIYLNDPTQAPNLGNGNYQFSATLQIGNRNNSGRLDAVPLDIVCCFVSDGVMTVANGNVSHQIAVISPSDIVNSREMPGLTYRNFRTDPAIMGGDWWDSLGNFGAKVNDFLKQNKIISTVGKVLPIPYASTVGQIADVLGYGMDAGNYGVGGGQSGGKMMYKKKGSLMYR